MNEPFESDRTKPETLRDSTRPQTLRIQGIVPALTAGDLAALWIPSRRTPNGAPGPSP
jgi:hypothetical protein